VIEVKIKEGEKKKRKENDEGRSLPRRYRHEKKKRAFRGKVYI